MADAPRPRRATPPLLFAAAALVACWTPVSAPFALVVGVAAAFLAVRALRGGARRGPALVAALLGGVAAVASAVVLALTAGAVTADLPGQPVVKAPSQAELATALDEAAARTRAERDRARQALPAGGREEGRAPGRSSGEASSDRAP